MAEQARSAARHFPQTELGPGLDSELIVAADPRRLGQVLTNLLQNAHATGARVALAAETDPRVVRLHVCDAGPGIPADLRERIFEPFASRSAGGTGLGLAIVARIMAGHGGTAAVAERAGWATCLKLTFPRGNCQSALNSIARDFTALLHPSRFSSAANVTSSCVCMSSLTPGTVLRPRLASLGISK